MKNQQTQQDSGFICPVTGSALVYSGGCLVSPTGLKYPIVDGIPLLVQDHEQHLRQIEQMKNSAKGAWYFQTQVDYYDHGPYRHALTRRGKIVRDWVGSCCAELQNTRYGQPLTVLDLGCGDGASSRWLASSLPDSSRLLLTDYNFERLVRARNLLGSDSKTYFLSRVTQQPLPGDSVDLVFSNHVIEHVPEDQAMLEEIHRLLRPGGYLILGCPTEGVFFWMLAYALSPATIRKSDHLHFYNRRTLESMGQAAGLEHLKSKPVGYGFPHWKVDLAIRRFRIVDDAFHWLGRLLFPGQATSIYLLFRKN